MGCSGSTPSTPSGTINPLMCLSVAMLLPEAKHHAYIRSASTSGIRIYEELIVLRKILCCLEHPHSTDPPSAALDDESEDDQPERQPWEQLALGERPEVSPPKLQRPQRIPIDLRATLVDKSRSDGERFSGESSLVVFPDVAMRTNSYFFTQIPFPVFKGYMKSVRYSYDPHAVALPDFILKLPGTEKLVLEGCNSITAIGHQFRGHEMSSINFKALRHADNLVTISTYFLFECNRLVHVDVSPMSNITTIGDKFMESCEMLESVNLSTLSKVTTIGESFLAFNPKLRSVDFGPIESFGKAGGMGTNLVEVGEWFLRGATSLDKVDLKTFTKIKIVGDFFISNCTSLRYLDVRPFGYDVESLGLAFLGGCTDMIVDHHPQLSQVAGTNKKLKASRDGRFTM